MVKVVVIACEWETKIFLTTEDKEVFSQRERSNARRIASKKKEARRIF